MSTGGQLLSQPRAHDLIRQGTQKAVRNMKKVKPYTVSSPVTMRLELVSRGTIPQRNNIKIIDGRTYEVTAPTVEEALNLL